MAKKLSDAGIDIIEVNVSCPNVKAGGIAFGTDPCLAAEVPRAVKPVSEVPVMIKLSPNVTDIVSIARACEDAGADALSLINTLLGMRIDPRTGRPVLKNNTGGLSGPAIFPVALRMVWQVCSAVSVPVMGMGGVSDTEGALEMLWAGASLVSAGTALFKDPLAAVSIVEGAETFFRENNMKGPCDIRGKLKLYD